MQPSPDPGPLAGVRILDFSRLLPGPLLTRLLADLGADVVKVEARSHPDPMRAVPPVSQGTSAAFEALNRGKRIVDVDMTSELGQRWIRERCAECDVVVEGFRPGLLARYGLSPAELRESNPRLIVVSVSGFGQESVRAGRAGHDLSYLARAGVLGLSPTPATPPVQLADVGGGSLSALAGLLAALYQREISGAGAHLDISMTRSSMLFMLLRYARSQGGVAVDELDGSLPCYRVYRCADGGAMAVAALEPKFFGALCEALDCPEVVAAGWSRGPEGEAAHRRLEAIFLSRGRDEWTELLSSVDCCVEPVLSMEEAIRSDGGLSDFSAADALPTDLGFGPRLAPAPCETVDAALLKREWSRLGQTTAEPSGES